MCNLVKGASRRVVEESDVAYLKRLYPLFSYEVALECHLGIQAAADDEFGVLPYELSHRRFKSVTQDSPSSQSNGAEDEKPVRTFKKSPR